MTHDSEEALALADRLALMHQGKVIQTGTPEALYLRPNCETAARLLGPLECFDGVAGNNTIDTELGQFQAEGWIAGDTARVMIRPEGIEIDSERGIPATVMERRMAVGYARVVVKLDTERTLTCHTPIDHELSVGERVQIRANPRFVSIVSS